MIDTMRYFTKNGNVRGHKGEDDDPVYSALLAAGYVETTIDEIRKLPQPPQPMSKAELKAELANANSIIALRAAVDKLVDAVL